ncbi:hypothetical protein DFA_09600 [Cavenderia fasciculata]|uniref:Uncharacterized protein n=1 Tax=Cavenderia fasciculata TaxID=261658 RepID=F4Q829_CACFS|nr:uncharacterized protein DFA_09600 [Cavenderia fasciculata]EGG15929.1 hypothetical protein DFA_09600 [Cavenderia fasciculata]|eukprot:XP_004352254.1 hypothetical protein DFA_09600 [Cavenderia fasciculata]
MKAILQSKIFGGMKSNYRLFVPQSTFSSSLSSSFSFRYCSTSEHNYSSPPVNQDVIDLFEKSQLSTPEIKRILMDDHNLTIDETKKVMKGMAEKNELESMIGEYIRLSDFGLLNSFYGRSTGHVTEFAINQ